MVLVTPRYQSRKLKSLPTMDGVRGTMSSRRPSRATRKLRRLAIASDHGCGGWSGPCAIARGSLGSQPIAVGDFAKRDDEAYEVVVIMLTLGVVMRGPGGQIVLRSRSGYLVGESSVIGLAPRRQTQIAFSDLFPPMPGKGLTAEIRPLAGSAAPFAYAAVVDNFSGDPTYYPAASPSSVRFGATSRGCVPM